MIKFGALSSAPEPGQSAILPHQSLYLGDSRNVGEVDGYTLHDPANDCLIQIARKSSARRLDAENFGFQYTVQDDEPRTLDLSNGVTCA